MAEKLFFFFILYDMDYGEYDMDSEGLVSQKRREGDPFTFWVTLVVRLFCANNYTINAPTRPRIA